MWEVKNIAIDKVANSTQMRVEVTYQKGEEETSLQTVASTLHEVKQLVRDNQKRLNEREEAIKQTQEGTFSVDEEKPAAPEKTATEVARDEWLADWQLLQRGKPLIDAGVLTDNYAPLVALRTKLQTNFKVEYLDLI